MKGWLWAGGAVAVAAITAVVLNFVGVFAFTSQDGTVVAAQLSVELSNKMGTHVTVTCPPSIREARGSIDDCQANAGHGTALIRLVQDDSRGHFHYTVQDGDVLAEPSPSPSPEGLPTTARSQDQYGAVEANFLDACTTTSGGRSAYCECMLSSLEDRGGPAEVARIDAVVRSGDVPLPPSVMDLYNRCWPMG